MQQETYIGLTENSFKSRHSNHVSSFHNANKRHETELGKYIWQLKDLNVQYSISWKIIKQCKPYSKNTKSCNSCLHEKFLIICNPELSTLNSRNKLVSSCRHRRKNLLSKYYHRFQFYATIGGFSSEENRVSAAVNHRYHIWKCMRRAGSVSNGFQLSLACSLFIFGRI